MVFPTPPFWLAMAITRGSSLGAGREPSRRLSASDRMVGVLICGLDASSTGAVADAGGGADAGVGTGADAGSGATMGWVTTFSVSTPVTAVSVTGVREAC